MSGIDAVWDKVSRRAPPNRRALIAGLRAFLATCENPHATLLTGRAGPASPDAASAHALESLVIEQYGRQLHSRLDVADWLRLLHDAENELIRNGSTLHTTRLAAFPTPQSSPFHPEAMRASQRVTLWRDAFGKWILSGSSSKTPDEWRAAIALSAVLYGALLDAAKVKGLYAMLDAPLDLRQAAGYSFIEFDMPFQGLGNHHLQRWFLDPLTELLVHRMPENDASQPASKLPAELRQLLMSNGVEKDKCPSSLADLISAASTWWSCHAAQIDLHGIRRTFCTHSIHPRTAQRLFGYKADQLRLKKGKGATVTYGEAVAAEDAHVLHPWLAESVSLLDAPSLEAARESIEALLSGQADDGIAKTYLGWLLFMLLGNSASKVRLTLSTIRKRYVMATERLLAILADTDPRDMDSAALEDIYSELVLEDDPDRPTGALAQALSDFHAYLVRAHGKKHIAKPSQVWGDGTALMPVDANFVSFDDYLAAQSWLDARLANGADPDDTAICKLVMAMAFRLGMRRMEIFGLRLEDIQVRKGMVCLIRPHAGRRLKTTNSKRLIPIDAFFDWRERRLLKEWVARRQAEEARDNLPAGCVRSRYLFAQVNGKGASERVSVDGVVDRICSALRAVTGDSRIFLHHLRHAFGTWTYLRLRAPDHPMIADFFAHLPETAKALRQSRRLRLLLRLPRTGSNRAHAHAVARLLGHSSPQVSMGHYVHSSDMNLAFEQCVHGLELTVAVGPPFGEAFLREIEAAEPRWRRLPAWILRRMATHALSRQGMDEYERMLAIELSCVVDALGDAQCDLGSLPQNVGWPGIVSMASYLEWDNSLPTYCDSGYEIRPLVNSTELQEEGKAMRNCVKEYDLLCAGEIARVFSIRHPESASRVATALIMREGADMTWRLSQMKGPRNHPALPAIHDVASRIASLYNQNEAQTASLDRLAMMDKAVAKLPRMPTGGLVID